MTWIRGLHAKTFQKEVPLHIDLPKCPPTILCPPNHPNLPYKMSKTQCLCPKIGYSWFRNRLKRGHPFFHGLGVSMPRPFRKGIACHPTTHMYPFCYHGICCFIIWYSEEFAKPSQEVEVGKVKHLITLCSRNFQNVKIRHDFVYHHSDFTWNHILGNSNNPKLLILTILEVLNFDFSKFEQLSSPKFTKVKVQSLQNCQKWHFWTVWIHQNLISHKIGVAVKWSHFNKVKH